MTSSVMAKGSLRAFPEGGDSVVTSSVMAKGSLRAFPEGGDSVVTSSGYSLDLLSKRTLCPNPFRLYIISLYN